MGAVPGELTVKACSPFVSCRMVGRGEAYPPVGREGSCRCECSSIAEGSRIECGEPWGRSHPSEREWERTQVAEPHGTGIPCRDQADKEAEDVRRIFNGSEIFPRVLPEDVFGRHRPQRLAEVLSIPAGREEAIAQERVQQVREHNDIPEGTGRSWTGGQE